MRVLIGCLFVAFIVGSGVFFAALKTQGQKEPQDEPTIVKKGQISDKEREYSKEYKKFYSSRVGKKLTELKQEGGLGITIGPADVAHGTDEPVITATQFLEGLSCKADAIVLGVVKNKTSHLSDDETFVYSDYDFEVERVFKDNSVSPIRVGGTISVARPGGLIKIDEQIIKFDDTSYKPLRRNKEYFLFLKFLPAINGYVVADTKGDFVMESQTFKSLSNGRLPKGLEEQGDSRVLTEMIQSAVLSNCNQPQLNAGGEND